MLGRDYKINNIGGYFHVYNRGVNKSLVFVDDQDYENFLFRAKILLGLLPSPKRTSKGGIRLKVLPINTVEILCFCLMPNHFHFLAKQNQINGIKIFIHRLCTSYSSYFNKKYNRVGHIFQGIYKSKPVLEDSYLTQLTAYIHLNPDEPFVWRYSSLKTYLNQDNGRAVLANPSFFMKMHKLKTETYKDFLKKQYDSNILYSAGLDFDEE